MLNTDWKFFPKNFMDRIIIIPCFVAISVGDALQLCSTKLFINHFTEEKLRNKKKIKQHMNNYEWWKWILINIQHSGLVVVWIVAQDSITDFIFIFWKRKRKNPKIKTIDCRMMKINKPSPNKQQHNTTTFISLIFK